MSCFIACCIGDDGFEIISSGRVIKLKEGWHELCPHFNREQLWIVKSCYKDDCVDAWEDDITRPFVPRLYREEKANRSRMPRMMLIQSSHGNLAS